MPKQKREIKGGSCSCGRGNVEMGISIRAAGGAQPQLLCFFRFCSYFSAAHEPTTARLFPGKFISSGGIKWRVLNTNPELFPLH